MKHKKINADYVRLIPRAGYAIKDNLTNRIFSDVVTNAAEIDRYMEVKK